MEIEYIRKLMSSHMVIAQTAEMAEWEEKMIAHAKVEGVLFAECVRENGQNYLWYDITGKQSLDTIVDSSKLGHELLCRILLALYEAVERLEQVLLRAEGVVLMPECIFQDYRTEQIFFCYYPGNEQSMAQSMTTLLEYLLERLDHGDERGVELAYGLYERVSKGDISIREIKELIHIPYEIEEHAEQDDVYDVYACPEETEADEQGEQSVTAEAEAGEPCEQGEWKAAREERESEVFGVHQEKFSPKKRWIEGLFGDRKPEFFKKKTFAKNTVRKGNAKKKITGKQGGLRLFAKFLPKTVHLNTFHVDEEAEETFVFEPEEEIVPQNVRPTVLLTTISQKPEGILRYEGKEPLCGDLQITGASYVIGSDRSCDGCIPSTTVSRRHARITVKEDIYFIEDLNSSNGTYVGGEVLDYKNKVSLQKNEIVIFADEKFRFI